jgi:hypothetical protein
VTTRRKGADHVSSKCRKGERSCQVQDGHIDLGIVRGKGDAIDVAPVVGDCKMTEEGVVRKAEEGQRLEDSRARDGPARTRPVLGLNA